MTPNTDLPTSPHFAEYSANNSLTQSSSWFKSGYDSTSLMAVWISISAVIYNFHLKKNSCWKNSGDKMTNHEEWMFDY